MSDYVPAIPDWFDTRRAAQVVAFFAAKAGGRINILRATKLVYLADRLSMEEREHPITGDNFVSMPFGPVNSYTYSYMKSRVMDRAAEWQQYIGPESRHMLPLVREMNEDDFDELSRGDVSILERTWASFKDISDQFELAEWTHRYCPEWRDPNGSSIPLDFATVYHRLGKDDPIDLAEQLQAERGLFAELRRQ